jgi:DNA-binding IscR family transcriptional regulator
VAGDTRTSPKTARKHLNALADEGFVATETGENGGTDYRRSSESLVVEQAADILAHISTDELVG